MSIYTLREINEIIYNMQCLIQDGADQETIDIALQAIETAKIGLSEKLENYAMVIKNIESDIAGLKAEEGRLNERRKGMEGNVKRMKLAMENALLTSGQKSLKGEKFGFNVQNNPPSLFVLDENLIPRTFYEPQLPKLNTKALMDSIKKGELIEGAELRQGQSLRIK